MTRVGLSHRRVIIVGAGQSGLAVAAALTYQGLQPQRDFVVIDAAPPGQRSWASRWHSMALLSDAQHSVLPPRRFPGDSRRHPRADEMADYLTVVEAALGVETIWGVSAIGVEHPGNGSTLVLSTTRGTVQTRNVVCATGAATHPHLPSWSRSLAVPGVAIHSSQYLYPRQIPAGDVLIVGGGNSGVQIAEELAASHHVTLSVRTPRRERHASRYPSMAQETRAWTGRGLIREPIFGNSYERLRRIGVTIVEASTGAEGAVVTHADGVRTTPTSVIFATGYESGDDWLPAINPGRLRSTTNMPGLFIAGMPRYGGARVDTIAGVWRDAARIARYVTDRP